MIDAASRLIRRGGVLLACSVFLACLLSLNAGTSGRENTANVDPAVSDVQGAILRIVFQTDTKLDQARFRLLDATNGDTVHSIAVYPPDWRVRAGQLGELVDGRTYGCFISAPCGNDSEIVLSDTLYCTPEVLKSGVVIVPHRSAAVAGQADTSSYEGVEAHNYPNPFNPREENTTIVFEPSREGPITMLIYDLFGHLVYEETFADAEDLVWDGRNGRNELVAGGGYVCLLKVAGEVVSRHKIAVIK